MVRIVLVNHPRKTPEELNSDYHWVRVKIDEEYVYQNYYDEKRKYDSYARKRAIQLLRKQEIKI